MTALKKNSSQHDEVILSDVFWVHFFRGCFQFLWQHCCLFRTGCRHFSISLGLLHPAAFSLQLTCHLGSSFPHALHMEIDVETLLR